jgi:hypothetical protein
MRHKRFLLLFLLLLPPALGMVFLLRERLYQTIMVPLLYLVWLGNLYLRSLDQLFLWVLLILISAIILLRTFWGRGTDQGPGNRMEPVATRPGRITQWAILIKQPNPSAELDDYLSDHLRKLVLATLAHQYHLSPEQMHQRLNGGHLEEAPEVLKYLQKRPELRYTRPPASGSRLAQLRARLSGEGEVQRAARAAKLEEIIHYLEAQVGSAHED